MPKELGLPGSRLVPERVERRTPQRLGSASDWPRMPLLEIKYNETRKRGHSARGAVATSRRRARSVNLTGHPRRSARMTHFCSLRLTHTKNTICRRARNGASDIIHAEGVRGDFPSSAPKARNPLTSHEEAACAGERIDRRRAVASPHSICRAARKALLPGGKTPPNWRWWWVTFGEQSRIISPECRSGTPPFFAQRQPAHHFVSQPSQVVLSGHGRSEERRV